MQDNEFEAAAFMVSPSEDGTKVRLTFVDEHQRRVDIALRADRVPLLLSEVRHRTERDFPRSIGDHEVALGMPFHLVSTQVLPQAGGAARVVFHLSVADGVRSLPVDLTRQQVRDLITDLRPGT